MAEKSVKTTVPKEPRTGAVERNWFEADPFGELERYFENVLPRNWMGLRGWDRPQFRDMAPTLEHRMPRVDVIEHDDEIVIHAEVPGVEKDDLEVSLTDEALTIQGATQHKVEEAEGDFHRREIRRGSFSRTVQLPATVDADKAQASFENGLLELKLPKVTKVTRRSVPID